MDREKVIKGLEVCFDSSKECNGCPYIATPYCKTTLRNDVTALLKEQEAIEPRNTYSTTPSGKVIPHSFCGKCNKEIYVIYVFCPFCGQAVKWE